MGIMGIFENVVAASIGVCFAGYLFDLIGNYWPIYWSGLGISIRGVILASMVRPLAESAVRDNPAPATTGKNWNGLRRLLIVFLVLQDVAVVIFPQRL